MGLWTYEHAITIFPTFFIMLIFSILMRRLLINKPYEIRMLPIKIISVIIVVIEIGKQWYSASIGYDLYHIPLHFCSIFVYVLPLMAFYRGKYQENVRSVACSTMTALLLGMFTMPSVIYSAERFANFFTDYLAFHTVFFHNLVILALFLTFSLDLHKPRGNRGEILFITAFGVVFVLIASTMSHVLQTNYSNFLRSTVGIVAELSKTVELAIGELPTTIIYTVTLGVLHVLLIVITNYLFLLSCICKQRLGKACGAKNGKK